MERDRADKIVRGMIQKFKENPKEYRALREKIKATKTQEEQIALLVDLTTSESDLAKLVPEDLNPGVEAGTTTIIPVTITLTYSPSAN